MKTTLINNIFKFHIPAVIAGTMLMTSPCSALELNAMPFDGSSTLRFTHRGNDFDETQEVRIRISGETGKQYQIFQRLDDRLMNENGEQLDRSVIEASTLQGSNSFGTLYLQGIEKLGFSDQLVYTSNSEGASDSLTITYRLDPNLLNRSGTFMGRLIYTVRPMGGGNQDVVDLNISIEAKGEFKVEAESKRGQNLVLLNTKQSEDKETNIRLSFSENFDGDLKVYQEVLKVPANERQEQLTKDLLEFYTTNAEIGELEVRDPMAIRQDKKLLYTTDAAADAFDVFFRLNDEILEKQTAGHYLGKVRYYFQTRNQEETLDVDLDITIQPVFELKLDYPSGGIDFSNLMPNMPEQIHEVVATVHSNMGKPYSVIQDVSGGLTNPKGDEIKKEFFTFTTEVVDAQPGKSATDHFIPVEKGSSPIFYSDDKGSSSEFKVIYRLAPYKDVQPGNYSLPVRYSLSEI
jgi:hypothetical protein